MTLLTAEGLSYPQLFATASNVCTTDPRLGASARCPPPNKNPGYVGAMSSDRPYTYKEECIC